MRSAPVPLLAACFALACARSDHERPEGRASTASAQPGRPTLPAELAARPSPGAAPSGSGGVITAEASPSAAPSAEPSGPLFAVTAAAAAVFSEPRFDNKKKVGYVRSGGRVVVLGEPGSKTNCSSGWYQLAGGGYLCGNQGTVDLSHPEVAYSTKQPALDEVLPYVYARNAKNGTPLYKSVPSREQMLRYEPYLEAGKKKSHDEDDDEDDTGGAVPGGEKPDREAERRASDAGKTAAVDVASALEAPEPAPSVAAAPPTEGPIEPEKPWWQSDDKDAASKVKLTDLAADSDDVLAKRMVAGFYVAVDKTFSWNGRSWYKTTRGLVAPADRFWQTAGAKFQGVVLDGTSAKLPMAWTYGGRKTSPTYTLDPETKKPKPDKAVETFQALALTGREQEIAGTRYSELADGRWIKNLHVRITRPGAKPPEVGANERWIDVNLTTQTLVAFEGERPVYATLISSGKESTVKDKDHRTPTGSWRVREKHVTTTMDGDGAAGDLPYSIEDVPYVMYFHNSYALHAAFWHRNFGIQMSHGCVNLAPLDAKWLFFYSDPQIPKGWHGMWSSDDRKGSLIVIHE